MLGILGILLALGLIMILAFRGISVLVLAPALALFAALFEAEPHLLGLYTQVFMSAMGGFVITYFPLFMLGALFGKMMDDSGAAQAIALSIVKKLGASRAVLSIVIACAILTYGGVSLFVVAFAIYPIAAKLFSEGKIPKRLIPATIALGSFTFTMTALPGSPAIQNTIPMPTFGTNAFAAPGLGVIAAMIMLVTGYAWIAREAKRANARGEGYGTCEEPAIKGVFHRRSTDRVDPSISKANDKFHRRSTDLAEKRSAKPDETLREHVEDFDPREISKHGQEKITPGRVVAAIVPIIVVLVSNFVFSNVVLPKWDASYLKQAAFGGVELSSVLGIWSTLMALLLGILTLGILKRKRFTNIRATVDGGAHASVIPVFNTASMVGFGAVIATLPAFGLMRDFVLGISTSNPLVAVGISINILAGITGSSSGGLSIALKTLGENYLHLADAAGMSHELLHRVTAIATGGLDTLPHCGAVITLLAISNLTHRQAYKDIFFAVVPGPLFALIAVIVLGTAFGSF
jgi:H+/gluconate symporter-like permease